MGVERRSLEKRLARLETLAESQQAAERLFEQYARRLGWTIQEVMALSESIQRLREELAPTFPPTAAGRRRLAREVLHRQLVALGFPEAKAERMAQENVNKLHHLGCRL